MFIKISLPDYMSFQISNVKENESILNLSTLVWPWVKTGQALL